MSPLAFERRGLVAAIARTEVRLAEMKCSAIARGVCACCVSASYGGLFGPFYQLEIKNVRRLERLTWIDRKLGAA